MKQLKTQLVAGSELAEAIRGSRALEIEQATSPFLEMLRVSDAFDCLVIPVPNGSYLLVSIVETEIKR